VCQRRPTARVLERTPARCDLPHRGNGGDLYNARVASHDRHHCWLLPHRLPARRRRHGVVYKAFDQRLHRHVALKVLPAAVSADEGRRRLFLREARAASALNDSHIIAIYDIFEHQGTDVLVMELVEGRTLREAIAGGPMAILQALDWTRQITEALGVAHGSGIVRRDLKPGNVMVTDRGGLKVLNFGLAKVQVTGDDATLAPGTQAGDFLGTLEYMSPEQARGKPVLRELPAKDPSQGPSRSRLALYLAKTGDTASALAELEKVLTPDVAEVNTLFRGAVTYELAGRRDEALTALQRALERGYGIVEIRMDPELANLRTDVRYHRLVARFDGVARQ
jgi:tetratricopeptide (TPR) repeat protein